MVNDGIPLPVIQKVLDHASLDIAKYTWLELEEVEQHLAEMRSSELYNVRRPGGYYVRGNRIIAHRRTRARLTRRKPA